MASDPALGAAEVAELFRLILGRPPESEAVVEHYLRMGLSAPAFARVLMDSEEVAERYRRRVATLALDEVGQLSVWPDRPGVPRVLLFGAYGNGNLGDVAQAEALAWLIERLLPGPRSLAATSWERRAPYAFAPGVRLAADALLRRDQLPDGRHGGLVVIGGGGVLGTPHFPLHARAWTGWFAQRGVPWALLGVGGSAEALAEAAFHGAYRTLIGGAAFVGVRDAATLAAAQAINPAATWFPDPVLARALLDDRGSGQAADWAARPIEALLIPRHPNGEADRAANRAALNWRAQLAAAGRRVVVAAMERGLDAPALAGEDVIFVDDWSVLTGLCREARVVVSLRLHGVIAGIAEGCVVHGLVQPKIGDLMASLGVAEWFTPEPWPAHPPDASEEAAATFRARLGPGLTALRARLDAAMRQAGQALAVTARA